MPFPEHGESFSIMLVDGKRIIDPTTQAPVPSGQVLVVPNNTFWRRRVRANECGIVIPAIPEIEIES
jgi:hypothetical protein